VSQAKKKHEADKNRRHSRISIVAGSVAVLLIAIVTVLVINLGEQTESSQSGGDARLAALASEHSPTIGNPTAKVHIVEFLDPACETCAVFFPMVKQWMTEAPGQLRLSVRHVAFHSGSDYAVKILEASRKQDKYWQTLEALLATQRQWAINHTVQPDRVLPAIARVGLNLDQLAADMNGMEILTRMEQDKKDSVLLKVSATPEYFVNGRSLPSFGQQQLLDLVREELQKAY
jgi:protein-disulfide isomerase